MKKPSIVFPLVDVVTWASRYGLSLSPKACAKCGKPQAPKIPFATGSWRGVQAILHECGPKYQLARARDMDLKAMQGWKEVPRLVRRKLL